MGRNHTQRVTTRWIVGRVTEWLAILGLVRGVALTAGTTTIGSRTLTAGFQADARSVVYAAAGAITIAGLVATRSRNRRLLATSAVVMGAAGVAALAEVWRCVAHWHAAAAQLALNRGYPASAAHNHYGHGVEVVVAGGLFAIVAALVIGSRARTPQVRLGLQEQFPAPP
jgi:hypothetical protein